jgi:hypothetical protein
LLEVQAAEGAFGGRFSSCPPSSITVTIKTSFSCLDVSVTPSRFDPAWEPAFEGGLDRATISGLADGLAL